MACSVVRIRKEECDGSVTYQLIVQARTPQAAVTMLHMIESADVAAEVQDEIDRASEGE